MRLRVILPTIIITATLLLVLASHKAPTSSMKVARVIVAAVPIPARTVITTEMVASSPWPAELVTADFIQADQQGHNKEKIIGMHTRRAFEQNEQLLLSELVSAP